jgi:putrescine importer
MPTIIRPAAPQSIDVSEKSKDSPHDVAPQLQMRRILTLWDLVLYGVVVIQPVAPMSIFGVLSERGRGHVVTAILIALVAMLFTGISYGRMARAYPSAGSAFTYVAQEINPAIGYVTGWSMVMDYMINPIICTIWCAQQAHQFAPGVPVFAWKIIFAASFTLLNLRGVKASARFNLGMVIFMGIVIVGIFMASARYILGVPHDAGYFIRPFYDSSTFTFGRLFGCTSIAVLTYIGFDGISTLSEEVKNPRRNILLATVLACVVIGLLSALEVYAAQLIWPASEKFPNVDTAYVHVAARTWAPFFTIVGFVLVLANFGSGLGTQLGASRLLYGMGRSGALPASFFGVVDEKNRVPRNNVIFIGGVTVVGSFLLSYGLGAETLNFGALIAFMGVNAAAFLRYYVRAETKKLGFLIPPVLGFLICLALWLNLSRPAMILGGIWISVGIAFGIWKTHWFRQPLSFEVPKE